jgi:hypothetical protein
MNPDSTPERRTDIDRAVVACSLWLHTGFIGAVAVAAGLIEMFDAGASGLSALALIVSGGVLAAASWRRGRTVLEDAERAKTAAKGASSGVIRHLPSRGPNLGHRAERAIERGARS